MGGEGLPWEHRVALGFGPALVETIRLVATAPGEAFRRMRARGEIFEALLFAIIPSWIGMVFYTIWSMLFTTTWLAMMPASFRDQMGALGMGAGGGILRVILAPVFVTIGLFIGAAVFHLCLMIVGGLTNSPSGFEGTFRVLAYASVADFAQVIPVLGGFVAMVWKIVLLVIGFATHHRTTQGKAVAAVLIPVVLCCGCLIVAGAAMVALLGGILARH